MDDPSASSGRDKWDEALERLTGGRFQESAPKDKFLEIPEHIGSETMDYDPTGDIIDYISNVVIREFESGKAGGYFFLGSRLNQAIIDNPRIVISVCAKTRAMLVYNADPPSISFQRFIYI